jgi:hypothetical protein
MKITREEYDHVRVHGPRNCPLCNGSGELSSCSRRLAPTRLTNENIRSVEQLTRLTERDLMRFTNLGPKSLAEIKRVLAERGLSLLLPTLPAHETEPAGSHTVRQ